MSVVEQFIGKWELCESKNFDEYLKELGVGWMLRKMAASQTPKLEWTKLGEGHYNMKTVSTLKTTNLEFKLGESFEEARPDGEKCTSLVEEKDGKLLHTMTDKSGKTSIITREILDNKLVTTCVVNGGSATAIRTYNRKE